MSVIYADLQLLTLSLQGCCISHPSGPNSPYPGGVGTSGSARAINDHPPPQVTITSQRTGGDSLPSSAPVQHRSRRRHHADQPLDQHINKPLRRHEWISRNRTWTPSALEHERNEFFDTRVTGREEIWQTLRAALEIMWEADTTARNARVNQQLNPTLSEEGSNNTGEQERAAAMATAQSILSAAEITLPTGDLSNGAYDAFGNYYPLPEHIVADPINISLSGQAGTGSGYADTKGDITAGEETAEEGDVEDEDEAARRREEKGKAVADMRDQVPLRARPSEGDRDVSLSVGRGESVRSIARRVAEEASVCDIPARIFVRTYTNLYPSFRVPRKSALHTWARS